MKKNFFKKLALVMALAITVTSVPATSASAAKAPGFKSTAVKVKVGQTKKYSTANTTKYSVKFKIGNKSVATIAKSGKAVKVTGVAAGKTTLKATFKSYATKKTTTAKVPVTVAEDAVKLVSVEATGAKKLVVTFSKAVDTTKAVIAVKKGTATPSVSSTTFAEDAKSVTINMGSKLTEGTYTVTVTGLTDEALTGSVATVDEALTSIEIVGTNLVAKGTTDADKAIATIAFKTLNQYGERMAVSATPNATSSFGTANVTTDCTATKTGIVTVTGIPTTLSIMGTSGSIAVIDTTKGVNATATVTYSSPATAKTMTIAGLYNVSDDKFEDITKGDTVGDYVILAQIADQYGNELVADKVKTQVTSNFVQGGNVTGVGTWYDVTVNDVDYVALPLTGTETAAAGTFYFTFVNTSVGLLANASYTVNSGTVIKSLSVSADDSIYQGQDNTLSFEAIDTEGNTVTKYSTLKGLLTFSTDSGVKLVKQTDGSAKLVYNPAVVSYTGTTTKKNSTIKTFVIYVNDNTSTNYQVKSFSYTTYQKREATQVTGLKTGTATAVASGQSFKLYLKNIIVEDQYSNTMTESEVKALNNIVLAVEGGNITPDVTTFPTNGYVLLTAGTAKDTTKLKLGVGTADDYDTTLNTVDPTKATNLTIKSIKDGYVVKSTDAASIAVGDVEVTGSVAGKTVTIPTTQYVITGNDGYAINATTSPETSKTGNLEVTVDTANGPVVLTKEYTFANTTSTVTTIESNDTDTATGTTLNNTVLSTFFDIKDQYGVDLGNASAVKYEIVDVSDDSNTAKRTISHDATNKASVTVPAGTQTKFTVTATKGTATATKTITMN